MATELFPALNVILIPGLHDSSPEHWQSRWQRLHPEFARVRQRDWTDPCLPEWAARIDLARQADARPALLVAHSFGCLAAVHSLARDGANVAGALLVAPADPDKFGVAALLPSSALPCPVILVRSDDDPWMQAERAGQWAQRWHAALVDAGAAGHINAASGLGNWDEGIALLRRLADRAHNRRWPFRHDCMCDTKQQ